MKDEKEIVWTEDMGFMPPVVRTEGRTICRYECQLTEYKTEIKRLRELFELERKDNIDLRHHFAKANEQFERLQEALRVISNESESWGEFADLALNGGKK